MDTVLEVPPVAAAPDSASSAKPAGVPNPILELPEVRARVWRMPVELCERLIEEGQIPVKSELIRGILLLKMSKSPLHQSLTKWLYDHFQSSTPAGCVVFQESALRLADSLPEPDVSVVRGDERTFRRAHATSAELVVEVAVSSLSQDRKNIGLYAEAGVSEYWIVLGPNEAVEVYRRPLNGVYQETQRFTRGQTLVCESVPGLRVILDELFG